jgi:hypothetical protein
MVCEGEIIMVYKSKSDVELVISLAKPEAVVKLFWASYQEGLQYQAWLEQMKIDYDALYPGTEEVTEVDEEGVETVKVVQLEQPVTFEEWIAEREVVTLTRTVFDEEGNEVEEEYEADGDLIRSFEANPDAFAVFEESDLYREFKKCVGLDYEGVVVPISKDTQDTTTALTLAFENGLAETNFHFENGNKLHLTAETFPAFRDWVMNERVSMFI